MPLRRYVDRHPVVSLILFWVIVPLAIFAIAVTGQVQNRHQLNRTKRLAVEGALAHSAICSLHADYAEKVTRGVTFLAQHPAGVPGITAATIAASIRLNKQTRDALAPYCEGR